MHTYHKVWSTHEENDTVMGEGTVAAHMTMDDSLTDNPPNSSSSSSSSSSSNAMDVSLDQGGQRSGNSLTTTSTDGVSRGGGSSSSSQSIPIMTDELDSIRSAIQEEGNWGTGKLRGEEAYCVDGGSECRHFGMTTIGRRELA